MFLFYVNGSCPVMAVYNNSIVQWDIVTRTMNFLTTTFVLKQVDILISKPGTANVIL